MTQGTPVDDREDWLTLHRVPGIGSATFSELIQIFGSPREALNAPRTELAKVGISQEIQRQIAHVDTALVKRDLEWLQGPDRHLITFTDVRYPQRLREIADPPPLLFVHGDPQLLNAPQIAIVGSRNPTRGGVEAAFEFARALAEHALVITSGIAHGIDGQSHRGALAAHGATLAVMGTGPDMMYPRAHQSLAEEIRQHGALVTEFPTSTPVRPENFPQRNRIISGLSLAVLVVEAARASGSLITARHALDQGRDVFAIPGSIHNPLARGCHALIKQGAKLVECVDDILEELPAEVFGVTRKQTSKASTRRPDSRERDREYRRLMDALGHDAVSIDTIVARTGLTANAVSSMLLLLELEGQVTSQAGGLYARLRSGDS